MPKVALALSGSNWSGVGVGVLSARGCDAMPLSVTERMNAVLSSCLAVTGTVAAAPGDLLRIAERTDDDDDDDDDEVIRAASGRGTRGGPKAT